MKNIYGHDVIVIGKCGNCGGRVVVPRLWSSVKPAIPICENCGAKKDEVANLPTIPMKPSPKPFIGKVIGDDTKIWEKTNTEFNEPNIQFHECKCGKH